MKPGSNLAISAISLLATACFGTGTASANSPAVQLGAQAGTSNTGDWAAGFAFTVTSSVNVTHLGKFDHEGDGIIGTGVALYNVDTGAQLATASLVGATPELNGSVNAYYASLGSPVALVTGTTYAVYAVNDGPTEVIRWGKTRTWGSEITLVQGRAKSGAALPATYAHTHTLAGDGFFGGTFKYSTGVAAGPVDASTSTVSASPTAVPADGTTSTITVTLKDSGSVPVAGKTVSLAGSPSGAAITALNAITDASGEATFTVGSSTAGTVVFTATDVTDSNLVINNTASVDFQELVVVGPVDASNSTVTASPASVSANGTATSTITVTLKDGNGNLIEGEGVTLGASPSGATISPSGAQTTDAIGEATFTVSSTTTGLVVFTATSVTTSETIIQTAGVEFTAPIGGAAINVNFYASNGSAYTTPQSDLVGVASTAGEYWNQFNGTSASPLLDASGATSTVAITGLPSSGWGSSTGAGGYTLLIASRAQFGKGVDTNFNITGLKQLGKYDLYIYSHNQVSTVGERALGTWSTTNTTAGSSSQVIDARSTLNGTTFEEGVNYVLFTDVEADGSGNIAILGDAADAGDFDSLNYRLHLCGIQIVPKDNDYTSWIVDYPGLGAPEEDDDGDGRSNDYERIFGLDPTDPMSMNPYTVPFDKTTGGFSYSRRIRGLTGWSYKVLYSINLVDWFEDTHVQQSPQTPANNIEIVDVVIDSELLAEPKLFVKLSAVQDGPAPAAPVLVSTWGSGATATLVFSMAMSESAATNIANYSVEQDGVGPISLTGASLSPDGKTVTLSLSTALVLDAPYTVAANNLTGSNGGVLASGTTGQFRTWDNDPTGIKVFILAGQSNMHGYGSLEKGKDGVNGAIGSLRYMAVNDTDGLAPHYRDLLDDSAQPATSTWMTRSDVKVRWLSGTPGSTRNLLKGGLYPSFGNQFGPEYGFGQVLGDHYTQPVLIIKTAWGGKSLAVDFRPPGAVAARGGAVGTYYNAIIDDVRDALNNLATDFPEWAGQGYQIAGFGWHQGWADGGNTNWANEYQANLANLIDDLRVEFGAPDLPVSIADSGFYGVGGQTGNLLTVKQAQDTIGSLVTAHPTYSGTVLAHDTAPHWRDAAVSPSTTQPHHWNFNGESYFLIGKGLGDNMVNLLPAP